MEKNREQHLAELIHRELAQLPDRSAPETLMPSVLARIERRHRQWWWRPWNVWPITAKILATPLMVASAGAFVFALALLAKWRLLERGLGALAGQLEPVAPLRDYAAAMASSLALTVRSVETYWLLGAGALILVMYLACVAAGTACVQVAVGKRGWE